MLWHDRKVFVAVFFLLFLGGMLVSSQVVPTYTAKATLIYAGPDLDVDLNSETSTRLDIAGQIFASGARVLTLANLREIAKRYLVNDAAMDTTVVDNVAMHLNGEIHIDLIQSEPGKAGSTIGFTIAYTNPQASVAESVVEDIAALYLNDGSQEGIRGTTIALTLLQDEKNLLKEKVKNLENDIAQFKQRNANNLPELHEYNLRYVSMLKEDVLALQRQIRDHEKQIRQKSADLAAANPYSYIYTEDGKRLYTPKEQLELLQAEYAVKASHYAPGHPDIIAIKKRIASLGELVRENQNIDAAPQTAMTHDELVRSVYPVTTTQTATSTSKVMTLPDHAIQDRQMPPSARAGNEDGQAKPAVVSDNPIFLRLLSERNSLDNEIKMMRTSEKEGKKKILEYEKLLSREPDVNRQLSNMLREYESAEKRLLDISERESDTKLDLAVSSNGSGSRYMLAEATRVPDVANTRKKTLTGILSVLIALGVSVGLVLYRGIRRHVIFDVKDLVQIAGSQAIMAIPNHAYAAGGGQISGASLIRHKRSG
jgi:uncharacterized protein involved in exopolysaccharide biosynthesis